nr:pyruvate decarboxylase 2-like [Tanacetum cinerariifolium]GEY19198.1 pyruvate decarboxylase 2-like [Tanacetum cinerariifolium]
MLKILLKRLFLDFCRHSLVVMCLIQPDRMVIANTPSNGCILMKDFLEGLSNSATRMTCFCTECINLKDINNPPIGVDMIMLSSNPKHPLLQKVFRDQ